MFYCINIVIVYTLSYRDIIRPKQSLFEYYRDLRMIKIMHVIFVMEICGKPPQSGDRDLQRKHYDTMCNQILGTMINIDDKGIHPSYISQRH